MKKMIYLLATVLLVATVTSQVGYASDDVNSEDENLTTVTEEESSVSEPMVEEEPVMLDESASGENE